MKKIILFSLAVFFLCLPGCKSPPAQPLENIQINEEISLKEGYILTPAEYTVPDLDAELPVSSFKEIWAYLVSGREDALKPEYPLSDLGYFGAELDSYGKLTSVPNPGHISFFKGRIHLVVTSGSRSLTHFSLMEGSREREELVSDLLEAAKPFDGLQIDFENVPPRDGDVFISFLRELKEGLGDKIFTIALPARTRFLQDDVYDYLRIKEHVDRILVMAYDEHWSGSAPGPIASMPWCKRVASFALDTIGQEKLIMGLPFYGRSWGYSDANRAFMHSGIERIKREQGVSEVLREAGIPYFHFETLLPVTVYYEDAYSLSARMAMYNSMGVDSVGFWSLGQETPEIWPLLNLSP